MEDVTEYHHVETLNAKAEQVAFIGRAIEREGQPRTLRSFAMEAALEKAEAIIGIPAPGKEGGTKVPCFEN